MMQAHELKSQQVQKSKSKEKCTHAIHQLTSAFTQQNQKASKMCLNAYVYYIQSLISIATSGEAGPKQGVKGGGKGKDINVRRDYGC